MPKNINPRMIKGTTGTGTKFFSDLDADNPFIEIALGDGLTTAQVEAIAETKAAARFTEGEKTKLAGLESSKYKGTFVSLAALQTAYPAGELGWYARVDGGAGQKVASYIWDGTDNVWEQEKGTSTEETAASIKTKYESNPDTNAFTNTLKSKLDGLPADATNWTNEKTLAAVLTGWAAAVADATLAPTNSLYQAIQILDWRTRNIDAVRVTTGKLADDRLSSNVPLLNAAQNAFTGILTIVRANMTDVVFRSAVTGKALNPFSITAEGRQVWNDGTTADNLANLYRSAAGVLRTDGEFFANGGMRTSSVVNTSTGNNSQIALQNTGTEVRTAVTGNVALKAINTVANTTSDLFQTIRGSLVTMKVTWDGWVDAIGGFRVNGVQKFIDQSYVNDAFTAVINTVPDTEKAKLVNTANWDANFYYIGEPIVNTTAGMGFTQGAYRYMCDVDNEWTRIKRG